MKIRREMAKVSLFFCTFIVNTYLTIKLLTFTPKGIYYTQIAISTRLS